MNPLTLATSWLSPLSSSAHAPGRVTQVTDCSSVSPVKKKASGQTAFVGRMKTRAQEKKAVTLAKDFAGGSPPTSSAGNEKWNWFTRRINKRRKRAAVVFCMDPSILPWCPAPRMASSTHPQLSGPWRITHTANSNKETRFPLACMGQRLAWVWGGSAVAWPGHPNKAFAHPAWGAAPWMLFVSTSPPPHLLTNTPASPLVQCGGLDRDSQKGILWSLSPKRTGTESS